MDMALKISSANIKTWSKLGQRGAFFGIAMPMIAEKKDNLKLLTADLSLLSGMDRYINKYPDKFLNVGIAEQNMIGIASGLAMTGKCVYASTYASFIAVRSLEHIRQHLSNMKCNVKIVGTSAGVIAAKSGISHWATEDIAFMRALPNLMVLSAADSLEAIKMALYTSEINQPAYIRLSGGLNCPIVYQDDFNFVAGQANVIKEGKDVALIATGLMVNEAIKVSLELEEKGITSTIVDMHTIKPLDKKLLKQIFCNHELIVTMEEHNVIGGMGSAVAEYKAQLSNTPRQLFIGMQDEFTSCGTQEFVWKQLGIDAPNVTKQIVANL